MWRQTTVLVSSGKVDRILILPNQFIINIINELLGSSITSIKLYLRIVSSTSVSYIPIVRLLSSSRLVSWDSVPTLVSKLFSVCFLLILTFVVPSVLWCVPSVDSYIVISVGFPISSTSLACIWFAIAVSSMIFLVILISRSYFLLTACFIYSIVLFTDVADSYLYWAYWSSLFDIVWFMFRLYYLPFTSFYYFTSSHRTTLTSSLTYNPSYISTYNL